MVNLVQLFKTLSIPILCWPVFCFGQGTLQITFDGPPLQPTNSQYLVQTYTEAGFTFSPLPGADGFLRNGGGLAPGIYPNDGSTYLQAGYAEGLQFCNGGVFGLASVDLAAYGINQAAFTVDFVGYHPDGSTIMTGFSGRGIQFQTYYFPSDWSSGLTEVQVSDAPWSMDNLVATVPEPEIGALLRVGMMTLFAYQLKRRKQP